MSAYEVKLQIFEGPLDLLLFLIKKEEIDIYEISISKIAKQYLEYVEFMQIFDLDIAGEFIVMAATLMRIKVKTMLSPMGEEDEEVEDFKSELVKNLLEYKRYKEASESFSEFESEERQRFVRSFSYEQEIKQTIDYSLSEEYSIFDLMSILKSVLDRKPQVDYYNIKGEEGSIKESVELILKLIDTEEKLSFVEIVSEYTDKMLIILTFLALLELTKQRLVYLVQVKNFQDIYIYKKISNGIKK